jgi:hypothetical protein
MKSSRRTALAAVMLLVPFSTALVALPAAAQHQAVVAPAPAAVGSLSLQADAGFAPGSTLRIELNATPGAQWAEVALGSSGVRVALRERHGGHYVGSHVVRQAERIDPTQLMTARLGYGSTTVGRNFTYPSEFQAFAAGGPSSRPDRGRGQGRRWDRQAPEISQVTPDAGERVSERGWTRISARVVDVGSGIDPASVSLRVDGREVTDGVRLQEDQVRYRADLAPGRHTAELVVRDRAGNASTRSWSFNVVAGDRYSHYEGRGR